MEKQDKTNAMVNTILYRGEECITQNEAMRLVGMTRPTFRKRVMKLGIEEIVTDSKRKFFRKQDIDNAIKNGQFLKWYM